MKQAWKTVRVLAALIILWVFVEVGMALMRAPKSEIVKVGTITQEGEQQVWRDWSFQFGATEIGFERPEPYDEIMLGGWSDRELEVIAAAGKAPKKKWPDVAADHIRNRVSKIRSVWRHPWRAR